MKKLTIAAALCMGMTLSAHADSKDLVLSTDPIATDASAASSANGIMWPLLILALVAAAAAAN